MKKTFAFLFTFLFLASCGKKGGGDSGMAELSEEQISAEAVAPTQAQTFEIHSNVTGFSRMEEEKIHKAFELIKRVVASDEFKKRVLNKKHNGKKKYYNNNGLSNAQIYKKFLEGSEVLSPGNNNAMDLDIRAYRTDALVIGYTLPEIKQFYINRRYLAKSSFTPAQVAMNITHEWLHKLGFGHEVKPTSNRPHSVPYAIGYIMRDLASRL